MKRQDEPTALEILGGIAVLSWLGFAWAAYIQMSALGAFWAAVSGIVYLRLAAICAPRSEWPMIFGWNDDVVIRTFFKMPIIASLFWGPAIRHGVTAAAPSFFNESRVFAALAIGSTLIGVVTSLWISALKPHEVVKDGK